MTDTRCPECGGPVQVWADKSAGPPVWMEEHGRTIRGEAVTVNFACDNTQCASGKAPWDTPRPREAT